MHRLHARGGAPRVLGGLPPSIFATGCAPERLDSRPMARKPIRKAVIPAAGLGTRFLPATKAVPKELLPIVDTPTIQHIVAEAVAAGAREVIIVNAKGKETIVDHFDVAKELEAHLTKAGKTALRDEIRAIARMASVVSIRQQEPLGLGHAVLCAKELVGDEPFIVMLGDDIIDAPVPGAKQLVDCWARHGIGTIALMEVLPEETPLYGVAAGQQLDDRTIRIEQLVEKPQRDPPRTWQSSAATCCRRACSRSWSR